MACHCRRAETSQISDSGLPMGIGKGYCLVQTTEKQVWTGTSKGRVVARDIRSRYLLEPPSLQPLLSPSFPLHTKSLNALVSNFFPSSHPRIRTVWSASQDQALGSPIPFENNLRLPFRLPKKVFRKASQCHSSTINIEFNQKLQMKRKLSVKRKSNSERKMKERP